MTAFRVLGVFSVWQPSQGSKPNFEARRVGGPGLRTESLEGLSGLGLRV